jgi:type VI secretion system secreted protein VgrG
MKLSIFSLSVLAFGFSVSAPIAQADTITLGNATPFAVLAGSAVTNTGSSVIDGDVGVSPGTSITGFPPGSVTPPGTINDKNAAANQAQIDLTTAYNALAGLSPTSTLTGTNLGGLTLTPGVYFFATSAQLTGTLTLNAEGLSNALWVFQVGTALTTASASAVSIINPGPDDALYWQVGSSATLGTGTDFEGNLLAKASITLNTGATDNCGRVLAENAAVTLDTNTISIGCADVAGEGSSGGLTGASSSGGTGGGTGVPEPSTFLLVGCGGILGLLVLRRNA